MKRYDCDGCYKGPFLENELVYEYGLLLCPTCLIACIHLMRMDWRERLTQWLEILKELVK